MKGNELVWRAIADLAIRDQREWENTDELAYRAGVPASSAVFALKRLTAIGAIEKRSRGGFFTVNPQKVLVLLAAWRNLEHDAIAKTTFAAAAEYLDRVDGPIVRGGPEAAVRYIDAHGINTVADMKTRIVYIREPPEQPRLPHGEDVVILPLDKAAERDWWDGYTGPCQTFADLFALPGWQAEEFRRALQRVIFVGADWDQRGERWSSA